MKIIEAEVKDKLMETMNDNDDHNKIIMPLMTFMTLNILKRMKTRN